MGAYTQMAYVALLYSLNLPRVIAMMINEYAMTSTNEKLEAFFAKNRSMSIKINGRMVQLLDMRCHSPFKGILIASIPRNGHMGRSKIYPIDSMVEQLHIGSITMLRDTFDFPNEAEMALIAREIMSELNAFYAKN